MVQTNVPKEILHLQQERMQDVEVAVALSRATMRVTNILIKKMYERDLYINQTKILAKKEN